MQERKFPVWAMTVSTTVWYFPEGVSIAGHCQCESSLLLTAWPLSPKNFLSLQKKEGNFTVEAEWPHTLSSMKTDGRGKNVLSLSSLWHSNWNLAGMRTPVPCMASPSLPWTWAMLRPGTWHRQTCWALPGAWELTGRASASTWAWPTSRLSA